jgi:hypothetical protein
MYWLQKDRIPAGHWPFMNSVRAALAEFEESLEPTIDLTEGNEAITITGCVRAYRHAVIRRVLDLVQSSAPCWNAGLPMGAIVCARSLLETIATFHSFLKRAEAAAEAKDWEKIGQLVERLRIFDLVRSAKKDEVRSWSTKDRKEPARPLLLSRTPPWDGRVTGMALAAAAERTSSAMAWEQKIAG